MPRPAPDRALRRMVADLAAMDEDDIASVLDQLHPEQRLSVTNLLREYADHGERGVEHLVYDVARVSKWLQARLDTKANDLTPHAREALRRCVMHLYPLVPSNPPRKPRPGFFARSGIAFLLGRSPA